MTDEVALRDKIDKCGLKMTFVAEKIGLSYQGFLNKIRNINEFTATEVQSLCDLLHITKLSEKEQIFFAKM